MGGSGVTDGDGQTGEQLTASELFHRMFPEYLAMGMTYRQFWVDDCRLVCAYRKAYKLRQEEQNRLAWLNGLYIYKALQSTPIVVHGFAKKGATVDPYPSKPIDFDPPKPKTAQEKLDAEVREKSERMKRQLLDFATAFNKKRREKELKEMMEGGGEDVRESDATST